MTGGPIQYPEICQNPNNWFYIQYYPGMSAPLPLALTPSTAPSPAGLSTASGLPCHHTPQPLDARALAALSAPGAPQPLAFFNATVRAGFPSPAADHSHKRIDLNDHLVRNREATFLFRVRGDSMIEVGINDGDVVVIRETSTAQNGDIVVALVEDHEATLKRFRRNGSAIALEAANPAYETRVFRDDQVKVQGKLVGLIRTY